MTPENNVEDPGSEHAPEAVVETNESAVAEPVVVPKSRVNLVVALVIVVVPLIYLAVRMAGNRDVVPAVQSAPVGAAQGIPALEAAVATSPTVPNKINLALAYINGNAAPSAIPLLEQVVAVDKGNAVAWNDLCVALTLQKDYARAIDDCNQALIIKPDFTLARNNLKWASDEKQKTLGAINAGEKTAPVKDSAFYINEGMNDIHIGDYDQAIVAWQAALKLDPHSAVAVNDIGTAYMMKKHPEQAVPYFAKAIQMDPTMQLAKNNMAWAQGELTKK